MTNNQVLLQLRRAMADVDTFIDTCSTIKLRDYQRGVAEAVFRSVQEGAGRSFVVMFPRQSGKNELQAQLETYLLCCYYLMNAELVKVSPTWKPQTLNAMRRLERVLDSNLIAKHLWTKESGYIYRCGKARIYFFSGQPRSNIVGATANVLLEVDEAQDVLPAKFDKDIAPMAASTNATRVFWGTAWTSRTLLARELRAARKAEKQDGQRRVFVLTADDVSREVPAYGDFVAGQIARLGRNHPMIKTQYFSEEIDAEGGLFPPARVAMMKGEHAPQVSPLPGKLYAMTLDVAGEDEAVIADPESGEVESLANPKRDSTALTVFEVDLASVDDPLINKPTYKVVQRREWVGVKHSTLYGAIKAMAELFNVRYLVVDCTGVGAGLTSFLSASLGDKVIPFEFNVRTKSDLLWDFLGIIDSGRYKDYSVSGPVDLAVENDFLQEQEANIFWNQIQFCEFEILPGPQKRVRWGVPDGRRDPATGDLVHDDLLISAALCAELDKKKWAVSRPTYIIQARDPLDDLDKGF
ncbi:hypothetical protein [Pelolinea submarina]|uniref:Phage terminase large subunit-like protein n=1 Tax=Pelolinea submarina TaxID=913107 RepID=A0A347ZPA6_9CHLR|nr:hypothetical protein [Pelolinea submarina]REG08738.1 hypothetical protein DFR64_2113 [Pelolinea submarina]BBB47137.1 hypothetical protein Pelsub_P0364 [Pelolinea submarina]